MKLARIIHLLYRKFAFLASLLQSPLLLIIRAYWGWQFFQSSKLKLFEPSEFISRFTDWQIPYPKISVFMAGTVECVGGLFLLAGLASRASALALAFTMGVAYYAAEKEALSLIWTEPDKFTVASPFLFLYASLIILAFGPGVFSVDWVLGKIFRKKLAEQAPIQSVDPAL